MKPSTVGGVYLGGAGNAFEGLGQLSGIAIDEATGKLVLISDEHGNINLPPLRTDDVVTIFKSVYQHGEAPFVSIDPDSLDPQGPIMWTRHGEGTLNTYVGWILFETDRKMKAYSLGEDNITKQPVVSMVNGYEQVLEAMFSGGNTEQNWERFWIVPDRKEIGISDKNNLSLMDVPLKVNTEKMVWLNGKLETDPGSKSSIGAEMFSKWFTKNYDKIADESYSLPPEGSGFFEPVPVFWELQRIAFITALAEQLRDQEIPLPFWMRNYEIKAFPTPETTPAHTVTRNNGSSEYTVYGGVNLSIPNDRMITRTLTPTEKSLAIKIEPKTIIQPYFKPVSISIDDKEYQMAILPGNNTKDLGSFMLNETDLSIQIKGDYFLLFSRKYNSFITTNDPMFGNIWTLDLPFLEKQKTPVKKAADKVTFKISYNLVSDLNSYYKKIDDTYVGDNKKIGFKTTMVLLQNGTNLHFNDMGYLVAIEKDPTMILYNRTSENKIFQIVGFHGQNALADIKLEYENNRIAEATGSNGDMVKYMYSEEGNLNQIMYSKGGTVGQYANSKDIITYNYNKDLVTEIKYNDELISQYTYNEKGQVLSEVSPGNREVEFSLTSDEKGSKVTTHTKIDSEETKEEKKSFLSWFKVKEEKNDEDPINVTTDFIQYDLAFRPVKKVSEYGQTIEWDYSNNEYDIMEISQPSGNEYTVKQSKDGTRMLYSIPGSVDYEENYNKAGQLVAVKRNDILMYQQNWNNNGELASTEYEYSQVNFEYSEDGIFQRTLITPLGENKTWDRWMEYRYDEEGDLAEISDFSGSKTKLSYDENREVSSINSNQGNIIIKRNNGLVDEIETSWGDQTKYYYDNKELIRDIKKSTDDGTSLIKFSEGQISEITKADGSKYSVSYYPEPRDYLVKEIQTPVNKLEYFYDENNQLINVVCNNKYEIKYIYDEFARLNEIQINSY